MLNYSFPRPVTENPLQLSARNMCPCKEITTITSKFFIFFYLKILPGAMQVPQGQQKLPLGLTVLLPLLSAAQAGGWFWAETAKNSPQQYVHYHSQNVRRLVLLGSLLVHLSILHRSTVGPAIFHFYLL
jgi:hypothetical protein